MFSAEIFCYVPKENNYLSQKEKKYWKIRTFRTIFPLWLSSSSPCVVAKFSRTGSTVCVVLFMVQSAGSFGLRTEYFTLAWLLVLRMNEHKLVLNYSYLNFRKLNFFSSSRTMKSSRVDLNTTQGNDSARRGNQDFPALLVVNSIFGIFVPSLFGRARPLLNF